MVRQLLVGEPVREPFDIKKRSTEFPDVLLAERGICVALSSLDEGEHILAEAKEQRTLAPSKIKSLQTTIIERRQRFADHLAEAAPANLPHGVLSFVQQYQLLRSLVMVLNAHYQSDRRPFQVYSRRAKRDLGEPG